MRKILLSFCVLICSLSVYAEPVSERQALAKAAQFMPGKGFVLAKTAESGKKGVSGSTPYYIFNVEGNGGFVIVSGDDRTKDILGYSENGALKEKSLPENVEWWLNYYAKVISSLDGNSPEEGHEVVTAAARSTVKPLILTNWNQDSPWNDQCIFDGTRCVTGCVATAMAQVVNYYKYPSKVKAIDGYSCNYTIPSLKAATLNWENMTNKDMAKLCRYCGQSVQMNYGPYGSGAVSEEVSVALVKYFGYNKSAHAIYRDGYSPEAWENEIYQELAQKHPVFYSGRSTTGYGHAFVCDGYKNGLFHVNWGWGGYCDGYFVLTVMDSQGPGNVDYIYSEDQSAIVGVRPVKGGTLDYPLVTISKLELASGQAREVTRGSASESFPDVYATYQMDYSVNSEDDKVGGGFAIYKGDELVQSILQYYPYSQHPGWYNYGDFSFNMTGLADGKYRIAAIYQDEGGNVHKAQGSDYRYVEAVIKGKKLTLTNYPLIGSVKLSKSKVTIQKGKTVTLKATISPSTLADQSVTWQSSDTKVATVTNEGKVKGVKAGTATITCTSSTGLSATCKVTVGYVGLSESKITINKGQKVTLTATVKPTTLKDQSVTWESSDTKIATVTSDGKVKGVKVGTATITCTSVATGLSAVCEVTVGMVTLNETNIALEKGKMLTLTATVYPTTLKDKSMTWASSNTKIATVTAAGKVKGVKVGTATITCTSVATGLSATCEVTVGKVTLNETKITLEKGKTVTLTATVKPTTLADQSVTWVSSNTKVAKVTAAGKVKGINAGTATITCTSVATGLSATCTVTVGYVSLSESEITIMKGKTVKLTAAVYPETLSDKSVTWESSNTKIATVTTAGKVKGVKAGTVTITCTSVATGLSATCTVTVKASASTRSSEEYDDEVTGIDEMNVEPTVIEPFDVYDLSGHKVLNRVTSLDGLPDGIYIVNGKKVLWNQ